MSSTIARPISRRDRAAVLKRDFEYAQAQVPLKKLAYEMAEVWYRVEKLKAANI